MDIEPLVQHATTLSLQHLLALSDAVQAQYVTVADRQASPPRFWAGTTTTPRRQSDAVDKNATGAADRLSRLPTDVLKT